MKPLHKELKDIRIERGISLEDISRETKIRIQYLEKIEEGDFSVAPAPFMRAFLREYAAEIGLNPDRVISKYDGKATTVQDEDFWKRNQSGPVKASPSSEPEPAAQTEETAGPAARKAGKTAEPPKEKPRPVRHEADSKPAPEPSGVVRAAAKIIADSAYDESALPESAQPVRADLRAVLEEKERKGPGALVIGILALIIIGAAAAILYFNGLLPF